MEDVLEELIDLADSLDKRGFYNLSDDLDGIIKKISANQELEEKEELRNIALDLLKSLED